MCALSHFVGGMEPYYGTLGNNGLLCPAHNFAAADSSDEQGFEYAPDGEDEFQSTAKPLSDVLNMQVYSPPMELGRPTGAGELAAVSMCDRL